MANKLPQISDLNPQPSEINLWVDDVLETFNLRPFGLSDEEWLRNKFGQEEVQKIFEELRLTEISMIIFHQLVEKHVFKAIRIKDYDDDGVEAEIMLTGPMRVRQGIRGIEHKIEVVRSLLQTIGISRPILDELTEEEVKKHNKKKAVSKKKKSVK